MRFIYRVKDFYQEKLIIRLTKKVHQKLQLENGYFSIFLNDSISNSIQSNGLYEKEILVPLFDLLTKRFDFKDLIAIDVGANIGNHSLFFANFFSKVISFEPNPITFKLLEVNTYFKKEFIQINNLGLSDNNYEINLSVKEDNIGGSSGVINYKSRIQHKIKTAILDDFLKYNKGNIGLIKIDVEGMETNVLRGSIQTIETHKPLILMELWRNSFLDEKNSSIDLLLDLDYEIFLLTESAFSKVKIIKTIKRVILILMNGSLKYKLTNMDYLKPHDYPIVIFIHKSTIFSKY